VNYHLGLAFGRQRVACSRLKSHDHGLLPVDLVPKRSPATEEALLEITYFLAIESDCSRHRNARGMGCSRALRDDISALRRVVKRLLKSSVETIAVVADGNCFREYEAYGLWKTWDTTGGPPYVVDAHHIV
jgi:hypothetical protein